MKTILLSLLSLAWISAYSQSYTITGKITDQNTGKPIPGVSLYLDNTSLGDATDASGTYVIKGVKSGTYKLIASNIGYISSQQMITVSDQFTPVIDFELIESITTLSEITIITGDAKARNEIPGSMYYVSPKQIQKYSYTDIHRTLRAVPGVNIQEEDGFGLRPNIGLRGTGVERSSKIALMEDGILMSPAPYSAPAAYYFPSIGRMQAVEILKGSSQIKYGPYTTGGAINLISTQIPEEFGGRVSLLGSSFKGRNLHSFIGNSHKNFGYMVETFQLSSDGFKVLNNGADTGFSKTDYLAKFRVNTNPDAKIYQSLLFKIGQVSELSNETYLGVTENDFEMDPFLRYSGSQLDQMEASQSQFSIQHQLRLSKNLSFNSTFYTSEFKRNWYKLDAALINGSKVGLGSILDNPLSNPEGYSLIKGTTINPGDALFVKANNRAYAVKGFQSQVKYAFTNGKIDQSILAGIRFHYDEVDRFQWVDTYTIDDGVMKLTNKGLPGSESNRVESTQAFASFIQYTIKSKKWMITPGLRFEDMDISRTDFGTEDPDRIGLNLNNRVNEVRILIPGISFEYKFNPSLNSFAGLHKGFAPPGSTQGSLPETSINYEWGWRFNSPEITAEAVLFMNNYDNLLGSDLNAAGGSGTGDMFNAGEVRTKGLEFQFGYDLLGKRSLNLSLPLTLTYTYTNAEFLNSFDSNFDGWGTVTEGDQFPYLAPHQLGINLSLEHLKFNINLNGRFLDQMRTAPGQGDIADSAIINSYMIWDSSASYKLHPAISLFGSLNNILNQTYLVARRPAGLRPGMPRSFNIGLRANF